GRDRQLYGSGLHERRTTRQSAIGRYPPTTRTHKRVEVTLLITDRRSACGIAPDFFAATPPGAPAPSGQRTPIARESPRASPPASPPPRPSCSAPAKPARRRAPDRSPAPRAGAPRRNVPPRTTIRAAQAAPALRPACALQARTTP